MRILFDHGTPSGIAAALAGHEVTEAIERGWERISNGALPHTGRRSRFRSGAYDRQKNSLSAEFDGP